MDVLMLSNSTILEIANKYGVSPGLVAAIITVESEGDVYAWRTEPAYRYLWDVRNNKPFRALTTAENISEVAPRDFYSKKGSRNTEWIGQQASWGPMQVMGAVARELGFTGHFPNLCGEQGVHYGCRLLKKLIDKHFDEGGYAAVAAAYNGGSPVKIDGGRFKNQEYVDKVLNRFRGQ
jgi:hypothetical protein